MPRRRRARCRRRRRACASTRDPSSGGKATATAPLKLARQAGGMRTLRGDEHDGSAAARRDEPREQRRLQRFDGRDDEPARTVGDLHGAPAAQLVDGAVERKCSGIAVDFLMFCTRTSQKACVSRVLGYQLGPVRSAALHIPVQCEQSAKTIETADFAALEARAWRSLLAARRGLSAGHPRSTDSDWLVRRGDEVRRGGRRAGSRAAAARALCAVVLRASRTRAHARAPGAEPRRLHRDGVGRFVLRDRPRQRSALAPAARAVGRDRRRRRHRRARRSAAHGAPRRRPRTPFASCSIRRRGSTRGAACSRTAPRRRSSCTRRASMRRRPATPRFCTCRSTAARLKLDVLLERLHERGLSSVFVEGGGADGVAVSRSGLARSACTSRSRRSITGRGRPGLTLPARERIAECLRPAHRVFTMGGDVLFDCDLRAAAPAAASRAAR